MVALKYYMWSYQYHFQIGLKTEAEALFRQLDPGFAPHVFLVGFREKPMQDRLPICVAPDDCEYQPKVFEGVPTVAEHLDRNDPEHHCFHSHPKAQENHLLRIKRRALQTAVLQAVEGATHESARVTFCSYPIEQEGYLVVVVLQLPTTVYESYYRLQRGISRKSFSFNCAIQRSFLDSAISQFLCACADSLTRPTPGDGFGSTGDRKNILRAAAISMMYTPSAAGDNCHGLHGLYDACTAISTLTYEGTEGVGQLVIAERNHPDIHADLVLVEPVDINDFEAVRKLLQMASGHLALLCDSFQIHSLGRVLNSYNPVREDVFVVTFSQRFVWDLTHAGQPLMHVRFGEPEMRRPGFRDEKFREIVNRKFPEVTNEQMQDLCYMARSIAEMKHGCMLVISSAADTEAIRLASQSTPIKATHPDSKLLPLITAIDGAVLVDLDGKCHAIGAILDGEASNKCTPSRGARFNSAIRYVCARDNRVVVVKSEDGAVDILPDLMPQIRRSELEDALKEFREVAGQETVDTKEFYQVRKWFDEHRFYLSKENCEEINRLIQQGMERFPPDAWKLTYPEFTPHEDMNDSFFVKEG